MSPRKSAALWSLGAPLSAALIAYFVWFKPEQAQVSAYRTAQIDRGTVRVAIAATGSLRALSTVDIGSQASGQVAEVLVNFNDTVHRGQVLAQLDPAPQQARVTQARADLAGAQALEREAQATLGNAKSDHARKADLVKRGLVARADGEIALALRDAAQARIESAQATVSQRQATLDNVLLDLQHTVIRAPVDGVVLLRQAEPGQTLTASFQTPVLFRIAEDLAQMQIELAVDEASVGRIKAGMPVRFTVDTYSERRYSGVVQQVRLAANTNQNVVTYPVLVSVANADLSLLPGMTASAEIEVSVRENVLRVPNAALRFKPTAGADRSAATPAVGAFATLIDGLALSDAQRLAFEQDRAATGKQSSGDRAQLSALGIQATEGGSAMVVRLDGGGGSAPSPQAIQQAISKRMQESFAGFRATLSDTQRAQFDQRLSNVGSAARSSTGSGRSAQLWQQAPQQIRPLNVRVGVADGSYTELLSGELQAGAEVLIGAARP